MNERLQYRPDLMRMFFAADYSGATATSDISDTQRTLFAKELETYCHPMLLMDQWALVKRDTIDERAKSIRVFRKGQLTATGDLTETTALQGNEETLSYAYIDISLAERGNAVAPTATAMATATPDLRRDAIELLGDWAAEKIEKEHFKAIKNNIGSSRIILPSGVSSVDALKATDVITTALISQAKQTLKVNNVPAFAPDGKGWREVPPDQGYYIMVLRPEQMYDLLTDTQYKAAAANAARAEVKETLGPAWRGFAGFWDGVLIRESTLLDFKKESGYTAKVAKSFIFGARAYARAIGRLPDQKGDFLWREVQKDYGRLRGFAVLWFDGYKVINPRRVFGVYTGATALKEVSESGT